VAIVADSSPLIALFAIGQRDLLPALFGIVLIPPAVESEISERDLTIHS
jgi:predicted nucleic acid-binding protein